MNISIQKLPFIFPAILFLLLALPTGASAQIPHRSDFEVSTELNNPTVIWKTQFQRGDQQWIEGKSFLYEKMKDGAFHCASYLNKSYFKTQPVKLDGREDYQIQLTLALPERRGLVKEAGLSFGRHQYQGGLEFLIRSDGYVKAQKVSRQGREILMPWLRIPGFKADKQQDLLVRKKQGHISFLVNGYEMGTMAAPRWYGAEVGFVLGKGASAHIHHLEVAVADRGGETVAYQPADHRGPSIMFQPDIPVKRDTLFFQDDRVVLKGNMKDPSGLKDLWVNNREVRVSKDGRFSISFTLKYPLSSLTFVARDQEMNETRKKVFLRYRPWTFVEQNPKQTSSPAKVASHSTSRSGANHLLLIGVNRYQTWRELYNAVKDCQDLEKVLVNKYQFEPQHVHRLYNEDATRENILEKLESLQNRLRAEDNLLIYYAGHGFYDRQSELGYWVPVEARKGKVSDYIRNSTLHDYLATIPTRHTFLIADACYAGSLFSQVRGDFDPSLPSRWAFTSGGVERVYDGEPGTNSPFASYLLEVLRGNAQAGLTAEQLIQKVSRKMRIEGSFPQTPKGSPLRKAGDGGGVFTFYQK